MAKAPGYAAERDLCPWECQASPRHLYVEIPRRVFFFKLINPQPCLNPNLEQMQCIWSVDLELQISPVGNQIFKERLSSVFLSLPLCFPKLSCQDQPRDLNFPVVTATGLYSFSRKGVRMP